VASRILLRAIGGVFLGILTALPARADTITITSGGATLPWDDPSSFVLVGDNFVLNSLFVRAPIDPQWTCFAGCSSGTAVNMSALLGGPPTHDLGSSYHAVINGVSYEPHEAPALQLFGDLWFDAGDVILPPLGTLEHLFMSTPFVFHGHVTGAVYHRDAPLGPTAFDVDVTGRGTATLRMMPDTERGVWRFPEASYAFEPQAPVPEPASILLITGGLATLLARRRAARSMR
jgi:hypothetical protein